MNWPVNVWPVYDIHIMEIKYFISIFTYIHDSAINMYSLVLGIKLVLTSWSFMMCDFLAALCYGPRYIKTKERCLLQYVFIVSLSTKPESSAGRWLLRNCIIRW